MTTSLASIPAKRLKILQGAPQGSVVVHEIYASVQGESTYAGLPCVFVRTSACNLRCSYCDTPHAFGQGQAMSLDAILEAVAAFGVPLVEVTGGEPLLQPAVFDLMTKLCDAGYQVLLETSGSLDISAVDARVVKIVDFKSPSSGELESNAWDNIEHLSPRDEVKLVLGDRADYEWAKLVLAQHKLEQRCVVLMGPVWGELEPRDLAAWIVEDRLPVRMQVQIHKYIWDPSTRGV
jgi:7-carboxy-7-deazaguanine synthase